MYFELSITVMPKVIAESQNFKTSLVSHNLLGKISKESKMHRTNPRLNPKPNPNPNHDPTSQDEVLNFVCLAKPSL